MKVKIIAGAYGWRSDKDGSVEPVPKGGTCDVSDVEATRLVKLGVASYVYSPTEPTSAPPMELPNKPPAPPPGGGEKQEPLQDTPGGTPPAEAPEEGDEGDGDSAEVKRLERMPKDDLVQMAQDLGVDISGARNNHERAVLIAAAGEPEDGEAPPNLGAGDIVQ